MYQVENQMFGCPIEALSSILGKKWIAAIIWNMQNQKLRFGELQRKMEGCSKKVLLSQLDVLLQNQIIIKEKKTENNIMESVYFLSESGYELLPIMKNMIEWSNHFLACGNMKKQKLMED